MKQGMTAIDPTEPINLALLPCTAEVSSDGSLTIGGVDLIALAKEFGTPLFVYDEEHLRLRCRQAVTSWGEGVAYGTKAFLCKEMAKLAYQEGMWLDVATGGELYVALAAGVPADHIKMHGNNKSLEELQMALHPGVGKAGVGRIVVDSFDEIRRLEELLKAPGTLRTDQPQSVMLRVTPGIDAHTHSHVMTGQEDTKFGFSIASGAAVQAVEKLMDIKDLNLVGIHVHIGSQILELEAFVKTIEALADFFIHLDLGELCIGGGLGVAYLNSEIPLVSDMSTWADALKQTCKKVGISDKVKLTAEPGRAIVAQAAVTLYKVGTIKKLGQPRTYVAVDGGMSDNPRPILYGSEYEAFLPRAVLSDRRERARVVGKHCESGDVLVHDGYLPQDIEVGDILAIPVTGAYGYSMASNYNKQPKAAVVFVKDKQARLVLKRESYEDLLRLEQ